MVVSKTAPAIKIDNLKKNLIKILDSPMLEEKAKKLVQHICTREAILLFPSPKDEGVYDLAPDLLKNILEIGKYINLKQYQKDKQESLF